MAPDWAAALEPMAPTLAEVGSFLRAELAEGRAYQPDSHAILNAFTRPLAEVRVLIVGQDPYPTPGDPMGLSFSVPRGRPMPRSLSNIARELEADTGERLLTGDLTAWADQGVMLLNRCLTVAPGTPGSHRGKGWEQFTDEIIQAVSAKPERVVFILWGASARRKRALVDASRHVVIESAHPSPLSARNGFFGSRPFSRANASLAEAGRPPVDWRIPRASGAL